MSWSWTLFRLKGIDIKIHITFVLILIWAAIYWGISTGRGAQGAIFGVVATLLLFVCVTLHEFGHSLVAMSYGAQVRDITLFPLGGLARMEEIPANPRQELAISLAGPAVNLIIAAMLIVIGVILDARALISLPHLTDALQRAEWSGMFVYLAMANLLLGLFNLLPAFPMDGGRVLRALLAIRLDYNQATQVAARVGQGFALLLGFVGFAVGDWILILIAVFIWFGAAGEQRQTDLKGVLGDVTVAQVMTRTPQTLSTRDSLAHAVELTMTTSQADFPVLQASDGRLIGMLTSDGLFRALRTHPEGNVLVTAARLAEPVAVAPEEPLIKAQERMAMSGARSLAVVADGAVVGMLTERDVAEGYRFLAAGGSTVLLPH